jgi:hypothetical protein
VVHMARRPDVALRLLRYLRLHLRGLHAAGQAARWGGIKRRAYPAFGGPPSLGGLPLPPRTE